MKIALFLVSVLVIFAISASAFATTIYTDQTSFEAQLQPLYNYHSLTGLGLGTMNTPGPLTYVGPTANGYSWTLSVANVYPGSSGLFSVPSGVSTWDPRDILTVSFAGSPNPVTAVGGFFFANDNDGRQVNQTVVVQLSDGTSVTLNAPGFRGFTSSTPIVSLQTWSPLGLTQLPSDRNAIYAGVGQLYVGSAVPEPGTIIAALGLLGPAGLMFRRKRA